MRIQRPFATVDQSLGAIFGGYRWLQLFFGLGGVLAIALLWSSVSTYMAVSRSLIVDHLREDLVSQAGLMNSLIERSSVQSESALTATVQEALRRSKGRIADIVIQNSDGDVVSRAGSPAVAEFTNEDIRSHIQTRQAIYATINTRQGQMIVEVFPFPLPPESKPPLTGSFTGPLGATFATLQVGAYVDAVKVPLWTLKKHLIVNGLTALILLVSLAIIAMRLRSYIAGLRLQHDIEVASSVQRSLLPSATCELSEFEIASDYEPIAGISGDFYDAFTASREQSAFLLGDISGKGIPAALLMGVVHGAVRSSCWTESRFDHQNATRQLNRFLCERAAAARFATMFWSFFDMRSQHLHYINAGHCPPFLLKAGHQGPTLRLECGGPVLGLLADAEFQQGSVRLDQGDCLILYSDGIVEATNEVGEEFGEDRLLASVQSHKGERAAAIRDGVLRSLTAFAGMASAQDDRTLVIVNYQGRKERIGDGGRLAESLIQAAT